MHLVPVNVESIRIGQPLPFPLMDKNGVLLAKKAFVVATRQDLDEISQRGGGLYIDVADSEAHHRAYVERLVLPTVIEPLRADWANAQAAAMVLAAGHTKPAPARPAQSPFAWNC